MFKVGDKVRVIYSDSMVTDLVGHLVSINGDRAVVKYIHNNEESEFALKHFMLESIYSSPLYQLLSKKEEA